MSDRVFFLCGLLISMISAATAGFSPTDTLEAIRAANEPVRIVVEGRQQTRMLDAEGLGEAERQRLLEFMDFTPGVWGIDPISGDRVDALRKVTLFYDGPSVRRDSAILYVFVNNGDPSRQTMIWTPESRLEHLHQNHPEIVRNGLELVGLKGFSEQIDRGIQPWDLSRSMDGGYMDCVRIALRLLEQAGDLSVDSLGRERVLGSHSAGIAVTFEPESYSVSSVRFPVPGRTAGLVHRFIDRLGDSRISNHPKHWLVFREENGNEIRLQTITFHRARLFGENELEEAFDWTRFADRVRDRTTNTVYMPDGSVDAEATGLASRVAQTQPVRFFDVVETDQGPSVRAHVPSGLSQRYAVIAFGFALLVVGAVAVFRGRAKP